MLKKFRPYIAICLLVQSISMIVLFFVLLGKKKSLATAFLAIGAVSAAVGGVMFWQEYGAALGLKAAPTEDDEDYISFDDLDLELDDEMLGSAFSRDDEEGADEEIGFYDEVSTEEASEDEFKGI